MKPRRVPSRLRCSAITSACCGFTSGTIIGTSGVPRWAELLETSGVSARAYSSSRRAVSSLGMSTAQKTKSTSPAIALTSEAFRTTRPAAASGIALRSVQRPATASR